jgi:hypothetical protein
MSCEVYAHWNKDPSMNSGETVGELRPEYVASGPIP